MCESRFRSRDFGHSLSPVWMRSSWLIKFCAQRKQKLKFSLSTENLLRGDSRTLAGSRWRVSENENECTRGKQFSKDVKGLLICKHQAGVIRNYHLRTEKAQRKTKTAKQTPWRVKLNWRLRTGHTTGSATTPNWTTTRGTLNSIAGWTERSSTASAACHSLRSHANLT